MSDSFRRISPAVVPRAAAVACNAAQRCGLPAKPVEARAWLDDCLTLIAAGQPLPPSLRGWLMTAIRRRLDNPGSSLDRLLGLRSRKGGRLTAFSKLPERDNAIRGLAGGGGTIKARAEALLDRVKAHRYKPDPELAELEARVGRIPKSLSQLTRIIAGRTCASQMNV